MVTTTEKRILESLLNKHIVGEKHTSIDNTQKCLPKDLRGEGKKAIKNLIREGYLVPKITSYGLEISLNPRRLSEIYNLLREP